MNEINIVCCIDDAYAQHCGVMLKSLIVNNIDLKMSIYILHTGLCEDNITKLKTIVSGENLISFIYVDINILNSFPIKATDYLSIATYLRLFIPNFIPKGIDKILYLDVDILIDGSIFNLYNIDINNYALAAAEDYITENSDLFGRLGYASSYSYFNAGVILINLKEWLKFDLTHKSLLYIKDNFEKIIYHDQDVLNVLFFNSKLFISPEYNLTERYFYYNSLLENKYSDIEIWRSTPIIIHFTGAIKPWFEECKHPYKNMYYKYLQITPWQKKRQRYYSFGFSILYNIKYYIKYVLTLYNIKQYDAVYFKFNTIINAKQKY